MINYDDDDDDDDDDLMIHDDDDDDDDHIMWWNYHWWWYLTRFCYYPTKKGQEIAGNIARAFSRLKCHQIDVTSTLLLSIFIKITSTWWHFNLIKLIKLFITISLAM